MVFRVQAGFASGFAAYAVRVCRVCSKCVHRLPHARAACVVESQ